ncbi:MAG: GTP 3',8-cyclase MoaA [Planctomycetes bacterium]|nr:GTP 3',8-cyclase MoaA [Planctomycetota bacterium]MCH8118264.1 GTP 3',8-cyclase MoaA [Planctomycetota bacterium]
MKIDYLRVSVTDRCNLRCVYCHPLCGCDFIERKEVLRLEEIYRIVRLFVECGIRKVRLTGGEPLVRKNIVYLVKKLAGIEEIEELTLTTNGIFLESLAAELKNAGLQRVNISVDSAENQSYKEITGFDLLPRVTKGIYKALEVGLKPVKINSVIIKGINVSQILPLAQMSVYLPVVVRFIEYCPTSKYTKPASDYVPTSEVREIIESKFGPLSTMLTGANNGPALYFRIKNSAGTIGFISGRSSTFCRSCNRLRLTSDGKLMPCLYSAHTYDLKRLIRSRAGDHQMRDLLNSIISEKGSFTKLNSFKEEFSMCRVGG